MTGRLCPAAGVGAGGPGRDFLLAFTVQEEIGLRGAKTAAFSLEPEIAVVVDATTAADTVSVPADKQVCRVGGGPVVSFMDGRTLYDRALYETIRSLADREGIPNQTKTLVAGGNDAGAIQPARTGVRVAAVFPALPVSAFALLCTAGQRLSVHGPFVTTVVRTSFL